MSGFLAAVGFLTVVPVPERIASRGFARAFSYFPMVGMGLGALVVCVQLLPFSQMFIGILSATCLAVVTGGLHWDGWADTMDAYFANVDRRRAREILADSRVGAHAVWGATALFLAQVLALGGASASITVTGLVVGRWVMVMSLCFAPPLAAEGVAVQMREGARWLPATFVTLVMLGGLVLLGAEWQGILLASLGGVLVGAIVLALLVRRFGGANGDVHGGVGLLTETSVWIVGVEVLPLVFG